MAINKPDVVFPPVHWEVDGKCYCQFVNVVDVDTTNQLRPIHKLCMGIVNLEFVTKEKKKRKEK